MTGGTVSHASDGGSTSGHSSGGDEDHQKTDMQIQLEKLARLRMQMPELYNNASRGRETAGEKATSR